MPSVIISSDVRELGETIARRAARAVGYTYLGPELLERVAEDHGLPVERLQRVLDPAARRGSAKNREIQLAWIQTAVLEALLDDGVVCTGLAAELYVRDVSHVLMVRVLSDAGARANQIAAENRTPVRKARKVLEREKAQRARWSLETFGLEEDDPALYDMVISLAQIEPAKVIQIVEEMTGYRKFRPMTYSRKCLADLALTAKIRATLLPHHPELRVSTDGETAMVHVKCARRHKHRTVEQIKTMVGELPGVGLVQVHAVARLPTMEQVQAQWSLNDEQP
jgi:cytidylate kinase